MANEDGEALLVSAAMCLGAESIQGFSLSERRLARAAPISDAEARALAVAIHAGEDPLGTKLCELRSPETRRAQGATFTPERLQRAMLSCVGSTPARVVDPGTGSGRLLAAAARRFPEATLIGVERDPVCAILARATLAVLGHAHRAQILVGDYRRAKLPTENGPTLFLANPPYVRHHAIEPEWKAWLSESARTYGLSMSQLAGLHVHFFMATAKLARAGDRGVFLTPAEWLDVNYGRGLRALLLEQLGLTSVHVVDASLRAFPDAQTTAAITCFEVGSARAARLAEVRSLDATLVPGREVTRAELAASDRWGKLVRNSPPIADGTIALGEICRVHRGAVTGRNATFIVASSALPAFLQKPCITRARELFEAGAALRSLAHLRSVIDLPIDLDALAPEARVEVERFLRAAELAGVPSAYVARARKAWWSVGLREPAPIIASYMARRPPTFVRNLAGAHHVNIAHGLYPRAPMSEPMLDALAAFLRTGTSLDDGRVYAGGLTKFEPREMERIRIPRAVLEHGGAPIADAMRVPNG